MRDFSLSPLFCLYNNVLILEQTENYVIVGISDIDDEKLKGKITFSFICFE